VRSKQGAGSSERCTYQPTNGAMRHFRLALMLSCLPLLRVSAQDRDLVITHVGVVDVAAGKVLPDQTVVIRAGRITALGPASKKGATAGTATLDGRGRFLIPGLWDMHVHLAAMPGTADIFTPVLVANGVLGARDTHSGLAQVVALKRAIAAGTHVGPRLTVAGELVDGATTVNPSARVVRTEAEAREAVRAIKAGGADFVKVYSALSRDLYFAIADEAKRQQIPFAGHVPFTVTAAGASNAGQRTFEHLIGVDVGTSSAENAILATQAELMAKKEFRWADAAQLRATFDSAKAAALFATLKRNDTWQVPTLIVYRQVGRTVDGAPADEPGLAYIPKAVRDFWKYPMGRFATDVKALFPGAVELVGRLNRAGVPILAGTDFPNPYVYPGFSLHDELGLLVEAGLTPAEALRAATLSPARFLGVADSLGSIAIGKVADLVLLDGNPLEDIGQTRGIRAVIQGGKVFDRAGLDQLLAGAAALANKEAP